MTTPTEPTLEQECAKYPYLLANLLSATPEGREAMRFALRPVRE